MRGRMERTGRERALLEGAGAPWPPSMTEKAPGDRPAALKAEGSEFQTAQALLLPKGLICFPRPTGLLFKSGRGIRALASLPRGNACLAEMCFGSAVIMAYDVWSPGAFLVSTVFCRIKVKCYFGRGDGGGHVGLRNLSK